MGAVKDTNKVAEPTCVLTETNKTESLPRPEQDLAIKPEFEIHVVDSTADIFKRIATDVAT